MGVACCTTEDIWENDSDTEQKPWVHPALRQNYDTLGEVEQISEDTEIFTGESFTLQGHQDEDDKINGKKRK